MRASYLVPGLLCLLAFPGVAAEAVWREPISGIELVEIPAGCFSMGADQAGERIAGLPFIVPAPNEVPRHRVCVDAFWIGKTEVTRAQWHRVMGIGDGAGSLKNPDRPMAEISWHDAVRFVEQLNRDGSGRYRLPTESEWEYVCHAGKAAAATQHQGDALASLNVATKSRAWYADSPRLDPHTEAVGQKAANDWGVFDMLGNVWEWTADGYVEDGYALHEERNPKLTGGAQKVIRGGSYRSHLLLTRCGARNFFPGDGKMPVIGLRVVRDASKNE